MAEDTELGNRRVAIKELRLSEGSPEDRQEAARAFQQEALLLSKLRHASLPGIYEQFSDGGSEYLEREYIEGQRLNEIDLTDSTYNSTGSLGLVVAEGATATEGSAIFSTFDYPSRPL